MKTALQEAQDQKAALERNLLEELRAFTDTTGLVVLGIDVRRIDVTNLGNSHPKLAYAIELEIRV